MSFGGLHIGRSGLAAAQRQLETAAHNVANANTDGYSRQRIDTGSATPLVEHRGLFGPGSIGQGVTIESVQRAHDSLAATNHRETLGQTSSWQTRAEFFAKAETILGPLGSGAPQALTDFWNSWESLSQTPDSITSRNLVMSSANQVVNSLTSAARRVDEQLNDLTTGMDEKTAMVNAIAGQVAQLNGQIKAASIGPNRPNDLMDQRDLLLADLAELAGAQSLIESDGDARVALGAIALVDGTNSYSLVATGVPPTLTWAPDGKPAVAGGELGSILELATSGTATVNGALDQIAIELTTLVNANHASGFDLDGNTGQAFFSATGVRDLSLAVGLTARTIAASASGAVHDGNHALIMGDLRAQPTGTGQTVDNLVNELQGMLGVEASHAARQTQLADLVLAEVEATIADLSGVSTDEELTDMLQYQRAYQASARVITIIDELLDRLINGTGATR
jgi:flagellar hook-associated protein 1